MSNDARLTAIINELGQFLHQLVRKHQINERELRRAVAYVTELGQTGEVGLCTDAFALTTAVDSITYEQDRNGTPTNIEGPYYRPDAPVLSPPYQLGREDEPGDVLIVVGRVSDAVTAAPLGNVMLDVWQTDHKGLYEHQDPEQPDYNLRGRLFAGDRGNYEFRTVVPTAYEIPKSGPVGALLNRLGRHCFRPKHLHFKVTRDGYQPLTTQVYFAGDKWLDSDTVGAAKSSLVTSLERSNDLKTLKQWGLTQPCFTTHFDFRLRPA